MTEPVAEPKLTPAEKANAVDIALDALANAVEALGPVGHDVRKTILRRLIADGVVPSPATTSGESEYLTVGAGPISVAKAMANQG